MKKLITIPDEIVEPLKILAVKNKKSFHAQLIEIIASAALMSKSPFSPK